jgi:hypothetical protein
MTVDQWLIPPLPDSIPPSILSKADVLVTKTAFLAGLLAPENQAHELANSSTPSLC